MTDSRYFQRSKPELNIIPMIDIMMFLLIFFVLIVLHMIPNSGMALKLPAASTAKPLQRTQVVIDIDRKGQAHYKGHIEDMPDLLQTLKQLSSGHKVSVIVAGDREVPLKYMVNVMNTVRKAGIYNVGIAAKH